MSREPRHEARPPADPWCARSRRVTELIGRRLADARAHAERGRLADANVRVLELRSGLVGHRPGDAAGLLRRSEACSSPRTSPPGPDRPDLSVRPDDGGRVAGDVARSGVARLNGRNDWLEAIQLSAQAIADLAKVSAASNVPACPEARSAALAGWEARHRDRLTRWARRALAERDPVESPRAEGLP
jgi:hypothetical protein